MIRRKLPPRPDRSAEFANWTPRPRPAAVSRQLPAAPIVSVPKAPAPVRSEAYRRLVASLPCIYCAVIGHSQAAHPNSGKAKGRKLCDLLCFPMCHEGANGCHARWDRRCIFGREQQAELEPVFAARTQALLRDMAQFDRSVARVLRRVGIMEPEVAA